MNHPLRQGFFARQFVNGLNHLGIGYPLVLQVLHTRIIDVVLLGNTVESILTRVPSSQV